MYLKVLQSTSNSYRFVYKLSSPWYFSALKKRGDPGYPCHSLYTLEERSSGSSSPVRLSPEDALFQDAPLFWGLSIASRYVLRFRDYTDPFLFFSDGIGSLNPILGWESGFLGRDHWWSWNSPFFGESKNTSVWQFWGSRFPCKTKWLLSKLAPENWWQRARIYFLLGLVCLFSGCCYTLED